MTYVNWGSVSCPSPAQLVYSGHAVSPAFDNAGGGAQYLCIDLDNLNSSDLSIDTTSTPMSSLVGVHFETFAQDSAFPSSNPSHQEPLAAFDGKIVRCAVCLTPHSDVLMVPNNQDCPADGNTWTMEYSGYLMAARDFISLPSLGIDHSPVFNKAAGDDDTHFRTEYVCVNQNPAMEGSVTDPTSEGLLAHTRIFCRDLVGLFSTGCDAFLSNGQCSSTGNHCALGPLGCVVCSVLGSVTP